LENLYQKLARDILIIEVANTLVDELRALEELFQTYL
jgi:hypothetical protein